MRFTVARPTIIIIDLETVNHSLLLQRIYYKDLHGLSQVSIISCKLIGE